MPQDLNIQQYRCENLEPRMLDKFMATQLTKIFPSLCETGSLSELLCLEELAIGHRLLALVRLIEFRAE